MSTITTSASYGPFTGDALLLPPYQGTRSTGVVATSGAGINKVSVMPFVATRNMRLSKARRSMLGCVTASGVMFAAIYGPDKTLMTECVMSTATAVTIDQVLSVPVTLSQGVMYYFGVGADNATATAANYVFDSEAMNAIGWMDSATFANGHCPAQLGTPAGVWPYSAPWAVFYGDNLPFG